MTSTTEVPVPEIGPEQSNHSRAATTEAAGTSEPVPVSRRRRWPFALALLVIAGIGAAWLSLSDDGGSQALPAEPVERTTAAVVRTDLVEIETFEGALQTVDRQTVGITGDGVLTEISEEGRVVDEGDVLYRVDGVAVPLVNGDTAFYRDMVLGSSELTAAAPRSGTITEAPDVGDIVEQGDVLYGFDGEPVVVLYGDVPVHRDLYWPEPEEARVVSTLASDLQTDQTRQGLVEAIADAEEALETARAETPSVALLNAIDDLTNLQNSATASETEINRANQAVASAQDADLERIDAAERALDSARSALVDFDEIQAAADLDEQLNEDETEVDPNLIGTDVLQLEAALVELGYDLGGDLVVDGEFTEDTGRAVAEWQRDLGVEDDGVVAADDIVFLPGPSQVLTAPSIGDSVSPGMPVVTVAFGDPLTGADVRQLEEALVRLGHGGGGLVVDDVFSLETMAAVLRWQQATGQTVDGIVHLGDVVVTDAAVRVAEEVAPVGSDLRSGEPVLAVTSVEQVVGFDLPTADQALVAVGDELTVVLPDGQRSPATVDAVSGTATTTPDGDTVFEVTLEFEDPSVVGELTEAPVDVEIVGSSAQGVLAVPVSALIARTDGDYVVEVVDGTEVRLVAVEPGFFADGLVEVESDDLELGDLVTLP